jgi:hypothetical protein
MTQTAQSVIAAKASSGTDLSHLSIMEIAIFHEAARASAEAWLAISNQGRAQVEPLLSLIDTEWVRSCGLAEAAVDELRARQPLNWDEAKARAQCLLQYAGDWFDWEEAARIVASAAKFPSPWRRSPGH